MQDEIFLAHNYRLPFNRASKAITPGVVSQYETDAQFEDLEWLKKIPSVSPVCWEIEVGLQSPSNPQEVPYGLLL